jgi:hypothetical protein
MSSRTMPVCFFKVKAVGDEIGDSCKLMDSWMLFTEARLFWRQNVILMDKKVQCVGYNSL